MNIGETIKKLRKQRDMTQEQLAEYLNISPQAVSRWEINSNLPDITFIPMLANIFNVTSDTLLGIDIEAKEKRILAIRDKANSYFHKSQINEAEKLLRDALKEYPNSYILMYSLANVLSIYIDDAFGADEDKKKQINKEVISLCEKVIAESTDDHHRYMSIYTLCRVYISMGEKEKAALMANKLPTKALSKEYLIVETLEGKEAFKYEQEQIKEDALSLLNSMTSLICSIVDDGTKNVFNIDEQMALEHKIIDIIDILIEKGGFGDFNYRLTNTHKGLTYNYIEKNDIAAALKHLKLAAKYAVIQDSMSGADADTKDEYDCLLFKGLKFPFLGVCSPLTRSEELLKELETSDTYSAFPASELEEIKNELRKHIH